MASSQKVSPPSAGSVYSGDEATLTMADASLHGTSNDCPPVEAYRSPAIYPTANQNMSDPNQNVDITQPSLFWGRNHLMALLMKDPTMAGYFEVLKKTFPLGNAHVHNHPYNLEYKKLRLKVIPGLSGISTSSSQSDNSGLMFKAMIGLLPPKPVMDVLVDGFFELVHPYFAILDKNTFKPALDNMASKLSIQKNIEFQFLALVFVVLRTGQLAIQHFNNDFEAYSDIVTPQYLSFADHCLSFADIYGSCSYCGLCCLFLARICGIITPEDQLDGGDGEKSPAVFGCLIQLAYSLGLDVADYNTFATGQNLWAILCYMDTEQIVDIGAPITVTTPLPQLNRIPDSLNDYVYTCYKIRSTVNMKYVSPVTEEGYSMMCALKLSAGIRAEIESCSSDTMSVSEKRDFFFRYKKASILLRYHANLLIYGIMEMKIPQTKEVFDNIGSLVLEITRLSILIITSSNIPWLFRSFSMTLYRRSAIYSIWLVTRLNDNPTIKPLTLDLEQKLLDNIGLISRTTFPCSERYFIAWKARFGATLLQIIDETRIASGKSAIFSHTSALSRPSYEISDTASSSIAPETPLAMTLPTDLFSWFPETNFIADY